MRRIMIAVLAGLSAAAAQAEEKDPFLWLEDIESERALDWARAQNARTLAELESDPRFEPMYAEALSILTSKERIPYGQIHNGAVYNFWQDDAHVRGLWRRASVESYRAGAPKWETLIDFDALAEAERRNWIAGSIVCLSPEYAHCMVELSDGGKDAGYWREFNTQTKSFVDGGFALPEAKSNLAWLDADTLIVGTDHGADSLTASGYARTLVRLERGADLSGAPAIFEGEATDVSVSASVEHEGGTAHVFIVRAPSFFEREYHYARGGTNGFAKLPLPPNADLAGVLDGRAIFSLREEWSHQGANYPQGSVVAYDLETGGAERVFAAAANQSVEDVEIGETGLVIQYLEDVAGKAARVARTRKGEWKAKEIDLPENGVVAIVSAGGGTDDAMVSFESLTVPDSLYYVDAKNRIEKIAETPAFYDATDVVVEQRFATSADGTKVPYFVMAKDAVLKQGNAPTVQYGYGGFLAATLPYYYQDPGRPQHGALAGRMWVSRGGVLVLSNIRGGSEYGPRWHQAALKENRQRAYDDFIAISEHLVETGVTSPEKLGAVGRSNGGLLMGAIMTQRPDLYAALDIGVPLFDMKRYNKLLAGASWMGEYGNPDIPEEWAYISQYSPYQNLKAGEPYPKVFFYTSTKDDRVHPGHARKAAAKLADLGYDFYYYENIEGGHGGAANQDQLAYRTALEYVYFAKMLMGEAETAGTE
ncbi:prolyl oligopeptidase family serine peptidase [Amphiplicatus metriothermophilus]|uniref:Prolyl oligopeptidase n=1 Tax=Amphiplicatus metriothermophilus TaxID=1519374 RepID=A0A239PJF5_9PROT|nr:prolyl oligopeptidase family serine peptidase [Amphiplicatus metriothermophilus]MBB5517750.1 prolyl oligopeptidase [Amphiplicatus metriothermophilus]SNT67916.1 prolyl oligopeptidase [Amphiplicatus metriothermophilus]